MQEIIWRDAWIWDFLCSLFCSVLHFQFSYGIRSRGFLKVLSWLWLSQCSNLKTYLKPTSGEMDRCLPCLRWVLMCCRQSMVHLQHAAELQRCLQTASCWWQVKRKVSSWACWQLWPDVVHPESFAPARRVQHGESCCYSMPQFS